jgi:tellurite resistance protein TerA
LKVKLENLDFVKVSISINTKANIDIACFGVDNKDKLNDDRYFVFYNQKSSPNREIISNPQFGDNETFDIKLKSLPSNITKLVFTATIDGEGDFSIIQNSYIRVFDNTQEIYRFNFDGSFFVKERAIIISEIYIKDNIWRLGCVAQGFNGGLSALLKNFGGEEIKEEINETPKQEDKIKLEKITLEKKGDSHKIDLSKNGNSKFSVNLNWSQNKSSNKIFGFSTRGRAIDLDLGCLYIIQNGKKGVIQALGNAFGSITNEPYIKLDKDDRSGTISEGENLIFSDLTKIKFAVIFAFIYKGITKWTEADGVVTIKQDGNPDIVIYLDEGDNRYMMCGIITISYENNNIKIEKINKYYKGHRELDKDFGFGFNWTAGTK